HDALPIWRVRHHRDHDVRLLRDFLRRPARDSAQVEEGRGYGLVIVRMQLVAALREIGGHGAPHDPESDESDIHDPFLSVHETGSLRIELPPGHEELHRGGVVARPEAVLLVERSEEHTSELQSPYD